MSDLSTAPKSGLSNVVRRLLIGAAVVFVAALALGLTPSSNCGSPWFPAVEPMRDQFDAALGGGTDTFYPVCQQHLGAHGSLAAALVAVAAGMALAAVLAWHQERVATVVLRAVDGTAKTD